MFRLAAIFILVASTSLAHTVQCNTREEVTKQLAGRFGEVRTGIMMSLSKSIIVEFWVNKETGSWTFTSLEPNGKMCIFASGTNYESLTEELIKLGEKV